MSDHGTPDDSTIEFAVVVPTLNAGEEWKQWLAAFHSQSTRPSRCLVIDSSSDDDTVALAKSAGLETMTIGRDQFNHGATRQMAAEYLTDAPVLVYLTQDALLANPNAFAELVTGFNDPKTGAIYGRQVPHLNAGLIESHARLFNYPDKPHVVNGNNMREFGIKAAFLSNSFCAYRQSALVKVNGFPSNTIVSEDMYVGARMLQNGWQLAYAPAAKVHHSHAYGYRQELRRYFDIGAFFAKETWINELLGTANNEGFRFVLSELRFLSSHAPWLIPSACFRTLIKYIGFKLGTQAYKLPNNLKTRLSGQPYYWNRTG